MIPFVFGDRELSALGFLGFSALGFLIGGSLLVAFWALVGQTPGMRLLSIHLEREGTRALGLRPRAAAPGGAAGGRVRLGLGVLAILVSPTRRGWHDRFAGTKVVYDQDKHEAPWSRLEAWKPALCGYEHLFAIWPPGWYVDSGW